jgi:hypothetical protein
VVADGQPDACAQRQAPALDIASVTAGLDYTGDLGCGWSAYTIS